jgi:tetratricopeptide (TPR) repeat protein
MLISALAAYAFQGLFVFDNLFTYIPLAAFLALAHVASARPWKQIETIPEIASTAAMTVAAPIAIIIGVLVLWFVNKPNIAAAHDLILALTPAGDPANNLSYFKKATADHSYAEQEISEQLVSFAASVAGAPSVSTETKTAIITYAVEEMKKEVAARPKDARLLLEYSLAFRSGGDLSDALTATKAALALSPTKQQIWLEKGTIEWQQGDIASAKADFDQAHALAPGYDDAATYAAAGNILAGDIAGAKALLTEHFSTTTVDSDILIYAYYQANAYTEIIPILEARARANRTADAEFRLASAYALVHRDADARAEIMEAVKEHPEAAAQGQQLLSQLPGQ